MSKIDEARNFLSMIGMPERQQADICVYTLLAMANIKEQDDWKEATNEWLRIHDIIKFTKENYGVSYAENSRETVRKQALHHFRTAALIEDNGNATNSPNYRYRLTNEAIHVITSITYNTYEANLSKYMQLHKTLISIYASKKEIVKMPDVVLYREDKDWIYFIESVTSVGPMDPKRILEISEMTKHVKSGKIFVTAFQTFSVYKKFSQDLAWETEVWISEMPDHMIHLNGNSFMGPRLNN